MSNHTLGCILAVAGFIGFTVMLIKTTSLIEVLLSYFMTAITICFIATCVTLIIHGQWPWYLLLKGN